MKLFNWWNTESNILHIIISELYCETLKKAITDFSCQESSSDIYFVWNGVNNRPHSSNS